MATNRPRPPPLVASLASASAAAPPMSNDVVSGGRDAKGNKVRFYFQEIGGKSNGPLGARKWDVVQGPNVQGTLHPGKLKLPKKPKRKKLEAADPADDDSIPAKSASSRPVFHKRSLGKGDAAGGDDWVEASDDAHSEDEDGQRTKPDLDKFLTLAFDQAFTHLSSLHTRYPNLFPASSEPLPQSSTPHSAGIPRDSLQSSAVPPSPALSEMSRVRFAEEDEVQWTDNNPMPVANWVFDPSVRNRGDDRPYPRGNRIYSYDDEAALQFSQPFVSSPQPPYTTAPNEPPPRVIRSTPALAVPRRDHSRHARGSSPMHRISPAGSVYGKENLSGSSKIRTGPASTRWRRPSELGCSRYLLGMSVRVRKRTNSTQHHLLPRDGALILRGPPSTAGHASQEIVDYEVVEGSTRIGNSPNKKTTPLSQPGGVAEKGLVRAKSLEHESDWVEVTDDQKTGLPVKSPPVYRHQPESGKRWPPTTTFYPPNPRSGSAPPHHVGHYYPEGPHRGCSQPPYTRRSSAPCRGMRPQVDSFRQTSFPQRGRGSGNYHHHQMQVSPTSRDASSPKNVRPRHPLTSV